MKIMTVDDHAIIRQGLRALLEQQEGIKVVGEADNGETAVDRVRELLPDVVTMDIAMPRLNGVEAIRRIHKLDPKIKIIVLSMHTDKHIVQASLKAGCHAYALKSSDFNEIILALKAVTRDERYLSPEITTVVVDEFLHPSPDSGPSVNLLTNRERQVLQLLTEGFSVKEIARNLQVSPKTIATTRQNILHKLDQHSIAGLTKLAVREGLTSLEF